MGSLFWPISSLYFLYAIPFIFIILTVITRENRTPPTGVARSKRVSSASFILRSRSLFLLLVAFGVVFFLFLREISPVLIWSYNHFLIVLSGIGIISGYLMFRRLTGENAPRPVKAVQSFRAKREAKNVKKAA
jgi:hypothetical protein